MASPNYKGNNPRPGPHRGPSSGPPRPAGSGPATGGAGRTSSGGPPRPAGSTGGTGNLAAGGSATGAGSTAGGPPRPNNGPARPGGSFGNGRGGSRGGSRGRGRGGYSSGGSRRPEPVEDDTKQKEEAIELEGTISAVLAGTMFRVQLKNGHEVLAHISGKMRKKFIRLVIGDGVKIEMSPYDMDKARIVYRL